MPLLSVSTLGPLTAGTDALFHCHWMQLLIRHSVAWALRDGEDVEVISTWPGAGSRTTPKAPSTILYENNAIHWGYQTGDMAGTIYGVKLLLDDSHKPKYQPAAEARDFIKERETTPVRVASDYLRKLVAHAQDTLDQRFGSAVQSLGLEYVLTVPAVWSDMAKSASIVAAEEAGIPERHLTLVSEPEAAALHCLHSIQPNTIEDLISYRVKSTNPLRLEEETEGTGGVCGSASLDERYKKHLKKRFGRKFEKIPRQSKQMAMKYWTETIKPNFTGQAGYSWSENGKLEGDYFIPIPGISDRWARGLDNGFLSISADTVKKIFDPVVQQVQGLVDHQIHGLSSCGNPLPKMVCCCPVRHSSRNINIFVG
ncbi:predicted protein [Aspergillus terreus NIH2624]|uniref:Uncharacterized protein n=1 Tax=Aspergillus terreus (strain NIH 2624 / FGSC A1156) TaxID=341663 RepID=Q0CDW7_ASPTN|nr:uncharacterized protein ATEG_08117 [Aspergillus terreus NIH2624]EAU31290.1 predicted protein [Aspergillus terreus NIH2624]